MPSKIHRISRANKNHTCDHCQRQIPKGSVYYVDKYFVKIDEDEEIVYSCRTKICPRCMHKESYSAIRLERFKPNCHHPLIHTEYGYIPGEAVMEPWYDECRVCGKRGAF